MAAEVGFEIVDPESGTGGAEVADQNLGNIDHKQGQVSSIVNRSDVAVY
jgi:hypothetical protein